MPLVHLFFPIYILESVIVQCSQTGRKHQVKLRDLTKEDGEISSADFVRGSAMIMNFKGKPYPVKFLQFKGWY